MVLRYTTVGGFWKKYGLNESVLDFQAGSTPARETVASATVSAGDYYLDQLGVNEDTLSLYAGSTQLTITTHYTFDSEKSKVTITSDGATALSGQDLTAEYDYNSLGKDLTYDESVLILEAAEAELERKAMQRFSNTTTIQYRQVSDEEVVFVADKLRLKKSINTKYNPLVYVETTVNGAYTTGGVEITLSDASLFPSSGTVTIGENKVTYSAKAGNVLTVPSSTSSISDGAAVSSTVVEVSLENEGNTLVWSVLEANKDYDVDPVSGYIRILNNAFFNEVSVSDLNIYPDNIKTRISYWNAWHEPGANPEIPSDVIECVYLIAARNLRRNTVFKSHINQRDNFAPTTSTESMEFIKYVIDEYGSQLTEIR